MIFAGSTLNRKGLFSPLVIFSTFSKNLIALLSAVSMQIIIQVVSVPFFLTRISFNQYAVWLVSFNIAQFSGLLDFGSISYAQNQVPFLISQKEDKRGEQLLAQTLNLLLLSNVSFMILILLLHHLVNSNFDLSLVLIFTTSNLLQSFLGIFEGLTRIDSKVAIGLYISNAFRIVEFIGTIFGLLFFSDSIFKIATIGLVLKLIMFIIFLTRIPIRYRFLRWGSIQWCTIISIVRRGIPFSFTKIADLMILSGLVVVLHGKIAPKDFVLFIATRTFFRFGLQVTGLVAHSFGYEMSASWVAHDLRRMQRLIRASGYTTLIISTGGFMTYFILGNRLFTAWTNSSMQLTPQLLFWGSCYSFCLSINQNQKTKFNAVNNNLLISIVQVCYAIILILFITVSDVYFNAVNLFCILTAIEFLCYTTVSFLTHNSISKYFEKEFI
jgi:hypothetical protein